MEVSQQTDSTTWIIRREQGVRALPVAERELLRVIRPARDDYVLTNEPDSIIDDAVSQLYDYLYNNGYLRPHIRFSTSGEHADGRPSTITIFVDAGQEYRIGSIGILGVPKNLAEDLTALASSEAGPKEVASISRIRAGRRLIRQRLILDGFADCVVPPAQISYDRKAGTVDVAITVIPNTRQRISHITLTVDSETPSKSAIIEELRLACSGTDQAWTKRSEVNLRAHLLSICQNEGYRQAAVEVSSSALSETENNEATRHLQATVTLGPQLSLGAISITGLTRTSETYVRSRLGLTSGDPLDSEHLDRALNRLRTSYLFRRIDSELQAPGADFPADTASADIALSVEEASHQEIEFHLGYGSYEKLRAGALFRDRNIFGWGRTWEVEGENKPERLYRRNTFNRPRHTGI